MVATPIGNLEDITLRALRVLKEADIIAAEDTRQTLKLLNHYEIKNRLLSYHEHNKIEKGNYLVSQLLEGKNVALVSDAGTPAFPTPARILSSLPSAKGYWSRRYPVPQRLSPESFCLGCRQAGLCLKVSCQLVSGQGVKGSDPSAGKPGLLCSMKRLTS